jgi:O-antigen/teichoic acid export membrane protein
MLRGLGKESLLYAIGTSLQRVASLLLVPVYTSALTVSEYGALETLVVIVQTLTILLNFGLSVALLRYYVECEDEAEVAVMVRTSTVLVVGLSLGMLVLLSPFFGRIAMAFFEEVAYGWSVVLAFLWAIAGALNRQLFAYYRARQDARTYVTLSVSFFLLLVALNIFLVRILDLGLVGVLLGNLIVMWGTNLWMAMRFWRQGRTLSRHWARRLLRFGFPLVFSMIGWLILNSADRYFLAYYRELSEVGLYSLGYKTGLIVQMGVIVPFQLAWGPFVFNQYAAREELATEDFSRVFTYLMLAMSIVGLGIFLFAAEFTRILGSGKLDEAAEVVPYVLLAYLFNGIYYWAGSFFNLKKRNASLSAIVFSMAGLNLLLNWAWIPEWGWIGAARATLVTIGGTGLLTLFFGELFYRVPLQWGRLVKLLLGVVIVVSAYHFIPIPAGIVGWLVRGGMLLLLPAWLVIVNFLDSSEVKLVISLPRSLLRKFQLALMR